MCIFLKIFHKKYTRQTFLVQSKIMMADQKTIKILFTLTRSALFGDVIDHSMRDDFTAERISDAFKTASSHDISHLVALGAEKNGLCIPKENEIGKSVLKAVYRYEKLKYRYDAVCMALESANVPFIPLKGSVIRRYYPQEWLRTSCDIDILVKKEDLESAVSAFSEKLGYKCLGKSSHDVSFCSADNVRIELHHTVIENGIANRAASVLDGLWESARLCDGSRYCYQMTDEMLYFYHIAHMAKHFLHGGCGIRPFIDLFLLDGIDGADHSARNELLERGGLLKLAEAVSRLSMIWLGGAEADPLSQKIEEYILFGGVYGSAENRIAVMQQKRGGRVKYILSKIFIPYDEIKYHYPVLEKHRFLTPFMEVRRWCKLIFCGHAKRTAREIRYNMEISADRAEKTRQFLSEVGL